MSRMSGVESGSDGAANGHRDRNSTADRALDILMMYTDEQPVISAAAVAAGLGVARSTAYRYLQSLVTNGFLEEAPRGGFRLGLRILEIARVARRGYGLSEIALPIMTELSQRFEETVLLTRRVGNLVVCVDRAEAGSRVVRISYERGSALPLNAGASALALLAWCRPDEVRALLESAPLERFTPATLTDPDALLARLDRIREDGYSVTRGELNADVLGIAAPVRSEDGRVIAAVSLAALASRTGTDVERAMLDGVGAAARQIGERLSLLAG